MEHNTNRMYWVIGIIVVGSLLIFGSMNIVNADVLPRVTKSLHKLLREKGDLEADKAADGYLYAKIREKSGTDSEVWIKTKVEANNELTIIEFFNSSALKNEDWDLKNERYNSFSGSIEFPDKINGKIITSIDDAYLGDAKFTGRLSLPKYLKTIKYGLDKSVFTGTLDLPNGLTSITPWAFSGSVFTGALKLPDALTSIGDYAFLNSTFTGDLVTPRGLKEIKNSAFLISKFDGKLKLNDELTLIGDRAFYSSKFTGSLKLPSKLVEINGYAFYNANFSGQLILPETLKEIDGDAFYLSKFSGSIDISHLDVLQGWAFDSSVFSKAMMGKQLFKDSPTKVNPGISKYGIKIGTTPYSYNYYDGTNGN